MLHRMHREGGRAGREISYCLGLFAVHTSRSLSSSFLRAARLLKFSPSGSAPTFVHLSSSSPDRPDHCIFRTLASHTRASTRPTQNLPRLKALRHLTASAHPYRISPNLYRFPISPRSVLIHALACFLRFVFPVLRPTALTTRPAPCDHVLTAFAFVCYLWVTNP